MTKKTDIFVAIDTQSKENAKKLIGQLNNKYCGIKIGKELFTSDQKLFNGLKVRDLKYF